MAELDAGIRQHLIDLELALLQPDVRASRKQLDALIADDFEEIGASGARFGKAEVLDRLPVERGVSFVASDFDARELLPGLVLLNYRGVRRDALCEVASLRSSLWRNEAQGWRMAFHQGTRLP